MKQILIIVAAVATLLGTVGATSSPRPAADCCTGGACCKAQSACCTK